MRAIALCVAVSIINVGAGSAHAEQSSCNWPLMAQIDGTLGKGERYVTTYSFVKSPTSGLVAISESSTVDLSGKQQEFPTQVRSSQGWADLQSKRSCQTHIGGETIELVPNPPYASALISLTAEKWWCTADDELCATLQQPLRICRKERSGKVAGASIKSVVRVRLEHDFQTVKQYTDPPDTVASTSWEQRVILDLLGYTVGNVTGFVFAEYLQNYLLRQMESQVNSGMGNAAPPDSPPSSGPGEQAIPGYEPIITSAAFVDMGGGGLGIRVVRSQAETQEGQACFLATNIINEQARRARERAENIRKMACLPFELIHATCPFR